MAEPGPITGLLVSARQGDRDAFEALTKLIYDELRRRAAALLHHDERRHSLRPTELVHEAFIYLMGRETMSWQNRAHFFAHASTLMRWLLVDRARARMRLKRGAGATCILLDERVGVSAERDVDVLAIDAALRTLAKRDTLQAEIVILRFFGGLSVEEVAEAKGLSRARVLGRHALKNALIPAVSVIAIETGSLLGGNMIVESVFGWPGLGRLVVESIFARNYPLVQAAVLLYATIYVLLNFSADLLYTALNPKVRL